MRVEIISTIGFSLSGLGYGPFEVIIICIICFWRVHL